MRFLLSFLIILVFAVSCSKEKKLNRSLEGDWNVTSINGENIVAPSSLTFTFEKKKDGKGNYSITSVDEFTTEIDLGTYSLLEDKTIYFDKGLFYEKDTVTITSYSKTDLTLTATGTSSDVFVMKKK